MTVSARDFDPSNFHRVAKIDHNTVRIWMPRTETYKFTRMQELFGKDLKYNCKFCCHEIPYNKFLLAKLYDLGIIFNDEILEQEARIYSSRMVHPPMLLGGKVENTTSVYNKLMKHQKVDVSVLYWNGSAGLLHQMGVGKSHPVIATFDILKQEGKANHLVIVCPKHIIYQWERLIKSLTPDMEILSVTKSGGHHNINKSYDIVILNFEQVVNYRASLQRLLQDKGILCVDELHNARHASTKRAVALSTIRDYAERRWALTGTPYANHPEDIHSIIAFISDDIPPREMFINENCVLEIKSGRLKPVAFKDAKKTWDTYIAPYAIRRELSEVSNIPKAIEYNYWEEMKGEQLRMYESAASIALEIYCDKRGLDKSFTDPSVTKLNPLTKIIRLHQIASNPKTLEEQTLVLNTIVPAKFLLCDESIREIFENYPDSKILIYTNYETNVHELTDRYAKYGAIKIWGGLTLRQRQKVDDLFNKDESKRILIMTVQCGKEGLNLQRANYIIKIERNMDMTIEDQSKFRIQRHGQLRQPFIINLSCAPIDQWVDDLLAHKLTVADALYDPKHRQKVIEMLSKKF